MSDDLELPNEIKELLFKETRYALEQADKLGIKGGDVKLFCLIYAYVDDFADSIIADCRVKGVPDYSGNAEIEYQVSKAEHSKRVAELSSELLWKLKELMSI